MLSPERLEVALDCADILDGKLPHWHRGRGDAEPCEEPPPDPEFERLLENAKREGAGRPPLGEDAKWNGEYWADDDPSLA